MSKSDKLKGMKALLGERKYNQLKKYRDQEKIQKADRQIKSYRNKYSPSLFQSAVGGATRFRTRSNVYNQSLRNPGFVSPQYGLKNSGRRKIGGGRGRPRGPSGRYFIPGVGPVGVYEYRKYFNQLLRQRRANIEQQGRLTPEQQQALASLQSRQQADQSNPEFRTIPDTRGQVSLNNINQEIDDATNLVP